MDCHFISTNHHCLYVIHAIKEAEVNCQLGCAAVLIGGFRARRVGKCALLLVGKSVNMFIESRSHSPLETIDLTVYVISI